MADLLHGLQVVGRSEELGKVLGYRVGKLLWGCGSGAIRVVKIGDAIPPSSLEDRMVEKGSVPISFDSPDFLVSLFVKNLLFS